MATLGSARANIGAGADQPQLRRFLSQEPNAGAFVGSIRRWWAVSIGDGAYVGSSWVDQNVEAAAPRWARSAATSRLGKAFRREEEVEVRRMKWRLGHV